jgi:acyl-CoA thioester hydrolase
MARIKIDLPTNSLTKLTLTVRITDINYGNHLGNDALVGLLHEARVQWLNTLGYTELNIEGKSIIMSDLAVQYINEAFYGQSLNIELFSGEKSSAGFELFYEICVTEKNETKTIARAKTGLVFFDYTERKITAMPKAFEKILTPVS